MKKKGARRDGRATTRRDGRAVRCDGKATTRCNGRAVASVIVGQQHVNNKAR